MVTTRPEGIDVRCAKRLPDGSRCGRRFDTAWLVNDRLHGITVETDLADQIAAMEAGRAYESPSWRGSIPYTDECRCGNRPKLKFETLTARVREAALAGATAIYI